MSSIDYYEVTRKLIGPIRPVGETHIDVDRFDNLRAMLTLIDLMLDDVNQVAADKIRHEASMKKAGELAQEFLDDLRDS